MSSYNTTSVQLYSLLSEYENKFFSQLKLPVPVIMSTLRRKVWFSFATNAILTFASFSNDQIIFPATILVYNLTSNKCGPFAIS